jgi:signal transduction histidine kinase
VSPACSVSTDYPTAGSSTSSLSLALAAVRAISAAPSYPALLDIVLEQFARAALAEGASLWLTAEGSSEALELVAVRASRDIGLKPSQTLSLVREPLASEAFRRNAPIGSSSAIGPVEAVMRNSARASLWAVPLMAGARRVGLVYLLGSRLAAEDYPSQEMLQVLAAHTALAMHAAKQAAAAAERTELLDVAVHDVKNMATSVKGYTQLVQARLPANASPSVRRWAEIVNVHVDRVVARLNGLLDSLRLTAGRAALKPRWLDLQSVLTSAADSIERHGMARPHIEAPADLVEGSWDQHRIQTAFELLMEGVANSGGDRSIRLVLTSDTDWAEVNAGSVSVGWEPPQIGEWTPKADGSLHLARALFQAHGGSLSTRDIREAGIVARARLPLTRAH